MNTTMPTVMLLCAGRGERLKPLTYRFPKVLCPVQGKPLLVHHLEQLAAQGLHNIVINHAYMGDKIRHLLGNGHHLGVDICYAPEPPGGLETGGGIVNMLSRIDTSEFITLNGDIYVNYSYQALASRKIEGLAHMVLVPNPPHNLKGDFVLLENNTVANWNQTLQRATLTFAGIAKYQKRCFEEILPGRFRVPTLIKNWAANKKVSGEEFTGIWFDIGTIARLRTAEQSLSPYLGRN